MFQQLQQIGLSDKEAKVYFASLELGSNTASEISKKAGVNRPTTYTIIEKLIKKGLMSTFEKGKKTLFQVEDPKQLLRLLKEQEENTKIKGEEFKRYLPELETLFNLAEEKPKVRYFEGKEGIISIREDYLKAKNKNIIGFYTKDDEKAVFSEKEREESYLRRIRRGIKFKLIYTSKDGPSKTRRLLIQSRFVPYDKFRLSSSVFIYDNKIAVVALRGKLMGIIIENKEIAETLKSIFNLAWEGTEKYQK